MTPTQYITGRHLAREGLGQEDLQVRLKISERDAKSIIWDHSHDVDMYQAANVLEVEMSHEQAD